MNTPVLLIHFNRPESTLRQIESLKAVAPRRIWILCDGARANRPDEAEKVAKVREVLDNLPWECEVKRLYREENLGCYRNVSEGISWFLDDCGAGIILEDDVIADSSFFRFSEDLLERFEHHSEVYAIAGHNRRSEPLPITADYGFSNYFECWGWATWKRAWDHFDPSLNAWRHKETWQSICQRVLQKRRACFYWDWIFRQVENQRRDSWAYRFLLTIWQQEGRVVIPRKNLTQNIGFNSEGTQTAHFAGMEIAATRQDFPLVHPDRVEADAVIDRWFEDGVHSKSLPVRVRWLQRKARAILSPNRPARTSAEKGGSRDSFGGGVKR